MTSKSKRARSEDEEYDADLAMAMELSMQQQKKTKVSVDLTDDGDEDLKKAIAESLMTSASRSAPTIHSIGRFKQNLIEGLSEQKNAVGLKEILEKEDLQGAFITSYAIDIDWFLSIFPKKVPLTLVKHYDLKEDKQGHFMLSEYITVLHPPLLPFSNMHAKLMLLLYPKYIRVVISSRYELAIYQILKEMISPLNNLTPEDWDQVGQVVWFQDFPKLTSKLECECEFARNLRHFMDCMQVNSNFLRQYDFREAEVQLVLSVPGYHTKDTLATYGHMLLRDIVRNHFNNNNNSNKNTDKSTNHANSGKKINNKTMDANINNSTSQYNKPGAGNILYYQTSSLGSTDVGWVAEFIESTCGGISKSIITKKEKGGKKEIDIDPAKLYVIFPSAQSVRTTNSRLKVGASIQAEPFNLI